MNKSIQTSTGDLYSCNNFFMYMHNEFIKNEASLSQLTEKKNRTVLVV